MQQSENIWNSSKLKIHLFKHPLNSWMSWIQQQRFFSGNTGFFFITVKTKCLKLKSSLCHGYWSSSDRQINNKSKHTLMYIFLSLVELMIILIKLSQSRVYTPSIASSPLNSLTPFFVRLIDSSGCSKEFIRFDAECSLSLSLKLFNK